MCLSIANGTLFYVINEFPILFGCTMVINDQINYDHSQESVFNGTCSHFPFSQVSVFAACVALYKCSTEAQQQGVLVWENAQFRYMLPVSNARLGISAYV